MILSWQENLPEEEMPPEWMWSLDDELVVWFEEVQERRREKYGDPDDDREAVPMMANELSQRRR